MSTVNKILLKTKIISFMERNTICSTGKFKNVFLTKSSMKPEGRQCVLWEKTNANKGDSVIMKGFLKNDIFIAESMFITKE